MLISKYDRPVSYYLPWQSRVYLEPLKVVEFVQLTTECCWGQPSDPCQRGCLTSHACVWQTCVCMARYWTAVLLAFIFLRDVRRIHRSSFLFFTNDRFLNGFSPLHQIFYCVNFVKSRIHQVICMGSRCMDSRCSINFCQSFKSHWSTHRVKSSNYCQINFITKFVCIRPDL